MVLSELIFIFFKIKKKTAISFQKLEEYSTFEKYIWWNNIRKLLNRTWKIFFYSFKELFENILLIILSGSSFHKIALFLITVTYRSWITIWVYTLLALLRSK